MVYIYIFNPSFEYTGLSSLPINLTI